MLAALLPRTPWQRNLVLLWLIQFCTLAAVSMGNPFIPLFIHRDLAVADKDVKLYSGLLQASFFICSAIMAPIWGTWADQKGRRLMIIRALLGSGAGVLAMAFAHNMPTLFVIRMAQGMTGGLIAAVAALVASMVPRERMGYSLGMMQTSLTSAHFVGPLIGGVVVDYVGYRGSFAIGSVVCFACAAVVWQMVREDFTPVAAKDRINFRDNLTLLRDNEVLKHAALAICLSQLAIMIINPILPLFVQHLLGKGHTRLNSAVGLMTGLPALTGFLAAPFWGRAGDRRGYATTLGYALLGSGLIYAPQAMAGSVLTLGILRAAVGAFNAGISPAAQAIAGNATDRSRTGAAISLLTSARMFGGFVGPVLGGLVATYFGWWEVFLLTACLQIAAASLVFKRLRVIAALELQSPPV